MSRFAARPWIKGLSIWMIAGCAGLLATSGHAQEPRPKEDPAPKKKDSPRRNVPPVTSSSTDPSPRGEVGFWMDRHKLFLDRVKSGKAGLLFIGDSITQGWEGPGREVWRRYYEPRETVNLGIGGDRTQHVLWRLDNGEIDGIKPKAAVVMIGTNNMNTNSPEEIAAGVKLVVKRLRDKLPETKVLLLGIFPRSAKPDDPIREKVKATNALIAGLADGKHVTYLDIAPTFLQPDGSIARAIMPDYLHLSPKGYRLWAEAIEPTLWQMLEGK